MIREEKVSQSIASFEEVEAKINPMFIDILNGIEIVPSLA